MTIWTWLILAFVLGAVTAGITLPSLVQYLRATPPPDLPEDCAPGWKLQCTRCARTRTLASAGGIRIGGNRNARKATLGWCKGCRGLRIIRVVHASRLGPAADSTDVG